MRVNTSRFGTVDVDDQRVITFGAGILGFPGVKQYVLLQPTEGSHFFWLQAVGRPDLAFVVTDPSLFVHRYRIPLKPEQMGELGLASFDEAQVFVIVNKHENELTGNLQGPLIVNVQQRSGTQLVLADRRFHTRVPLVKVDAPMEAISA